jgi:hypothetical protein
VRIASYPLLSDSLQSKGGGFLRFPFTLALLMEPGIKKLHDIKFIPVKAIIDMQIIKIKLVSVFLRLSIWKPLLII